MSKTVEEVLSAWRDAERVLDSLPQVGRDHEDVALAVLGLRSAYQSLTDDGDASHAVIRASQMRVEETRTLLARIRGRVSA